MREGTIKELVALQLQKKAMTKAQLASQVAKKFGKPMDSAIRYMGVVFTSLRNDGFEVSMVGKDRSGSRQYTATLKPAKAAKAKPVKKPKAKTTKKR